VKRVRFDRRGLLMITADSFGAFFDLEPVAPFEDRDGTAIVRIAGPLSHAPGFWWDDYESIKCRVREALASSCGRVVLHIDSPGGDATGCLEASREIRGMAAAAGKELIAFTDGMATSAAYALACAASKIYALPSAIVGSVGVIDILFDVTEANKRNGYAIEAITSGARKADRNADVPISDGARAATQVLVDGLAELFYGLVSEARGIGADEVRALEAGLFHGAAGASNGLIDGTTTFEELLAAVAGGTALATKASRGTMDKEKLLAELRKMAEGEDEKEAAKAKKAIAALEAEDEEPAAEDDKEEPAAEGEDESKKDEEPAAEGEDEEPKAKAAVASKGPSDRLSKIEARLDNEERARLLASRPDFDANTKAWLSKAPLATVRNAVKAFPKTSAKAKASTPASAVVTPPATKGAQPGTPGTTANALPPDEADELDRRMGLKSQANPIRREGRDVVFGVMTLEVARAAAQKGSAQ
jgi:ClpP class serine protease